MTSGPGWSLAQDTGIVERPDSTYLAVLPDGPIVVLDEVSSVILRVALAEAANDVAAKVAAAYGVSLEKVASDVSDFLAGLERGGLIRRRSSSE